MSKPVESWPVTKGSDHKQGSTSQCEERAAKKPFELALAVTKLEHSLSISTYKQARQLSAAMSYQQAGKHSLAAERQKKRQRAQVREECESKSCLPAIRERADTILPPAPCRKSTENHVSNHLQSAGSRSER